MTHAAHRTLPDQLTALLTEHLPLTVTAGELTPSTTFESLGVDSLMLMELVVAAEEKFGMVLPEEALDLSPSATLADAARVFADAR
ncbi:phosphopantetheine-binding protein [Streptomyces sp. NPDC028635]|uniref:phosphopantetheine-binding protein n=1 Tax=Streptomyces sp. NPDC028635 TaxID=3154800 RepID=UPI0033E2C5DE